MYIFSRVLWLPEGEGLPDLFVDDLNFRSGEWGAGKFQDCLHRLEGGDLLVDLEKLGFLELKGIKGQSLNILILIHIILSNNGYIDMVLRVAQISHTHASTILQKLEVILSQIAMFRPLNSMKIKQPDNTTVSDALATQGHKKTWQWICSINGLVSSTPKSFNHMCHFSVGKG